MLDLTGKTNDRLIWERYALRKELRKLTREHNALVDKINKLSHRLEQRAEYALWIDLEIFERSEENS
jgi:hypothetical protein